MVVYHSKRNEYVIARRAKPDVAISWYDLHNLDPLRNKKRQKHLQINIRIDNRNCYREIATALRASQ